MTEYLRFADEYVQPIVDGEKTATVRYNSDLPRVGDEVPARTEAGTDFATLEVKRVSEVMAVEAVSVLDLLGAKHGADDSDDLMDTLSRHYERGIRPSTFVQVIVFEVSA